MLDVLSVFKRNTNQLFGICIDILNVGRSLQQLSLSMQILAINGVVQAAKVGEGKGRPILALVEFLNHTPGEIRPEVETIERLCAKLAKLAAHSSNIVWRYYQLVAGLLTTIPHEYRTSSRRHVDAIPAHYCHSSGNFSLYDPTAGILFSGDIGAALVPSHETGLMVTDFDQHVEYMRGFHLRWMPSTSALRSWTQRVRALKPNMICPQHGSVFQGEMVGKLLDWLDTLEVGQWNDTAPASTPQKAA